MSANNPNQGTRNSMRMECINVVARNDFISGRVERACKPAGTHRREMFRPHNRRSRLRELEAAIDGVASRDGHGSSRQPLEDMTGLCGGDEVNCLP